MKKFIYILTLTLLANVAFAQVENVNKAAKAASEGNYEAGQTAIDLAVLDETTKEQAKTWYYYGFIYKSLYKAKETGNSQSPYRTAALKGLKKCIDLDPASQFAGDCKKMIKFLTTTMYNDAVRNMSAGKFEESFNNYEGYISAMNVVAPAELEDKVIFYAGYTAFSSKKYDEAISYLNQAKAKNYNDPLLYFFLGKIYQDKKDYEKALEVLKEGKEKHPLAKDLNELIINIQLSQGNLTAIENELKQAITVSPDNLELYVTLAFLYEKKADMDKQTADVYQEKAKEVYKQIIEKNPNHMRANYNMALLFYNKSVNMMNSMDEDDDDIFALEEIQDNCIALFRESLPYFEKAHEIEPNNTEVLIGLGAVYFSLNQMDKHEEFNAKLKKIQESEGNN